MQIVALVSLLIASVLGWFFALPLVSAPPHETAWIEGVYLKKEAAARSAGPSKIVIIGGSSSHFSLSAEQIGRLTHRPAVNLATHAALGMPYLLHRARRSLQTGDVAVLAIEYQLLLHDFVSDTLARYITYFEHGYLARMQPNDAISVLLAISPIKLLRNSIANLIPLHPSIYRVERVNEFGDETANVPENMNETMRRSVAASPQLSTGMKWADSSSQHMRRFLEWAQTNGIEVFAVWPALLQHPVYESPLYSLTFSQAADGFAQLGVPVLGDPKDYFLPLDKMFDTMTHANSEGRELLSNTVARELCEQIRC